jgi:signal transduction histidine kinase/CheY-like chemotaxis protein/AraC-like DNA-binding protein
MIQNKTSCLCHVLYRALFFWVIIISFQAKAQQYVVKHLDNTVGLSNDQVKSVFQDSDRLLWVSTAGGLNVYNGSSFLLFKSYDLGSSFTLPDNVILNVLEDNRKQIWICTEKGVTRYNKEDGSLHHYFNNVKQDKYPGSVDYYATVDANGEVVAGLRLDSVLYAYDHSIDTFYPLKFDIPSLGMVAEVGFDDQGRLWTLSIGGAMRVFVKKGNVFHLLKQFTYPSGIHLFFVVEGHIFFTSGAHELYSVTNDLQAHIHIQLPRLINDVAYFQGHYFLAYNYKGLQELDANFKPVQDITKSYPELNGVEIMSFRKTGDNVLWLASSENGLYKIAKSQNNFGTITGRSKDDAVNASVTTFAEVENEFWIGTKNKGIIQYKDMSDMPGTGNAIEPVNAFYASKFNNYYTIKKGYDNNYYIGSEAYGVTIYDPRLKKFTPWSNVKGVVFDKDFYRAITILPCPDSSIFVGYLHGLMHLKILRDKQGHFSLVNLHGYKNDRRFLNLGNNQVSALLQKDQWLLEGYQYAGLVLLNMRSGNSINLLKQDENQSLTSNNITGLFIDSKNNLWIGTDFGLNKIKFDSLFSKNPRFRQFNVDNGLPDDMVHGILEDNDHFIWISTNKGLAKIDPDTFKIIQYRAQDGLQNDEYNDGAVYKDKSGKLYFGGISGFDHFDPKKISIDNNLPNLLISDLSFGGKNTSGIRLMIIKPGQDNKPQSYTVGHDQNLFHLKIESASGSANVKFQYRYILHGFDEQWHASNENSRIDYSNLPAGNYDFRVEWSSGAGNWSGVKQVFHLTIKEYFWLTDTARIIYFILISGVVYSIFRIRKTRREYKNQLYVEGLIRTNEQKLYQEKVNFFTNITHELQTPLTLILGSIERYEQQSNENEKKANKRKFIKIANQEAFRLQYLVHQLLEFRKAESGHAKVVYHYFNASNLIKNITELFGPLKEQKALGLDILIENDIMIRSDKDKFEKIIFNLFSNAFKHTAINESITLCAELYNQESIKIEIANSGFEAGAGELSFLFEQFYTIDHNKNTKESSGIGLALTKQLTEILGGTIAVKAEDNWITFTLILPLNLPYAGFQKEEELSSDKPSYLVRSIAGSMEIPENSVVKNNDLALMENLEAPGKKSVLIVEDDANIRLLLKELLLEKYVVYESENGKSAIDILKKIVPNLILSDVVMSDMDGLTLCTRVKNNIATCHIPFLLLSARNAAEEKLEGFEAGADGYLTKPYNSASLLKKITELIDYRENISSFLNKDQYYQTINHNGLKLEDQNFLNQVIKVISENISNADLDAAQLERELSLSRMSLYRKLMALANMTPAEFIKNYRLRQAATLLRSTNLTVSEIYYQTGFNNQSYFYREFKRLYHNSPKEYRELNQLGATQ